MTTSAETEPGAIGVRVGRVHDTWTVISVLEGGPAARAGLQPGDVIVAVEGSPTKQLQLADVVQRIGGPVGSEVSLSIGRRDATGQVGTPRDVSVVRATLPPSAQQELEGRPEPKPVVLQLNEAPPEPKLVTVELDGLAATARPSCNSAPVIAKPQVVLEIARPIVGLVVEPVGVDASFVVTINGEATCAYRNGAFRLPRVSGRVGVHFAPPFVIASKAALVVMSRESPRDPLLLSPLASGAELSVRERDVRRHFPFLGHDRSFDFYAPPTPTLAQGLFLAAPRSLFVVPKYDLRRDDLPSAFPRKRMPAKNEALLVERLDDRKLYAYDALGDRFVVYSDALQPAPTTGPLVVPPPDAAWPPPSSDVPPPHDDSSRVEAAKKKFYTCVNAAGDATDKQIETMIRNGERVSRRREDAIWDAANAQADKRCGKAQLDSLIAKEAQGRAKTELLRRSTLLAKIRQHLAPE